MLIKERGYSYFDLIHGYIYMRWPFTYISMGIGKHPVPKTLKSLLAGLSRVGKKFWDSSKKNIKVDRGIAEGYHGKAVPLSTAYELVSINQEISLKNLEQVIPFERATDIVMKNPDRIAVMECPCRKAQENPCEPLDVCLIVGDPFVSFVLEHHPKKTRAVSPQEARLILEEEHARGHVQHAFFKDAMLNRFYAICNCCACCCGAMMAQRNGTPMIISSGFIAEINQSHCQLCGKCIEVCQFGAIRLNDMIKIDEQLCMGCGVCVDHCPHASLNLVRDYSKPEPLHIKSL